MELGKYDDLNWFPIDKLPASTIDYIIKAIECYMTDQNYLEFRF